DRAAERRTPWRRFSDSFVVTSTSFSCPRPREASLGRSAERCATVKRGQPACCARCTVSQVSYGPRAMTAPRGSKTLLVRCGSGDSRSRSDTVDDDVRREREVVVQRLDGEVELLVQHSPALERGAGLAAWRQRGRP